MGSSNFILKTLVYSDIFDFPLNKKELWQYLIGADEKIKKEAFTDQLQRANDKIGYSNGWYFLKGRADIVKKRLKREKISREKIYIAKKIVAVLSVIPTICLIGISGSVAMKNAETGEDIDFFIITRKNTLWFTRFFSLFILQLLGMRRKRKETHVVNKICINMLLDENQLLLPKERHDLYTAHEVVQMMPLLVRNDMHKKFLSTNSWVKKFLPNTTKQIIEKNQHPYYSIVALPICYFLTFIEFLAKHTQLWYMKNQRTIETVTNGFVAFHPQDARERILEEYKKRLTIYAV